MLTLDILLFMGGLFLIFFGSKRVLSAGNNLASRLALNGVAAGALIFAMVTAMPELFSTVYTVYTDSASIGFANLVGTNIHNIPLAIGVPALLTVITYEKFARRICLTMLVAELFSALLIIDGQMNALKGGVLLISYAAYVIYVIKRGNNHDETCVEETKSPINSMKIIFNFISGGILLLAGCSIIVVSSLDLADVLGISKFLVALVVMSLGPVIPETSISIIAALKGQGNICMSNALGDNIFTIFIVLGIAGIISPFHVSSSELILSVLPVLLITLLLFVLTGNHENKFTKKHGIVLLGAYVAILLTQAIYLA